MLQPAAEPPTGWLEATRFCGAAAGVAEAGGMAAVATAPGGASGVEATLAVGAALAGALAANGLVKGSPAGA